MAIEIGPALGLTADSKGLSVATEDLKKLTAAAGKAETAADSLVGAEKRAGDEAAKMGDKAGKAASETDKLGRSSKTTDGALSAMASRAASVAGALAAMAASALSVGAYIKLADAWSDMRSQVGAAIGDMAGANDMMQRLVDIANASYSPLDQTVQVYARNVAALRDLGKSATDAANFTESLNHMLVITATKGERAASVQQALSKAMAVGKLQAEGLETVLANGGAVAAALASQLGTTVSGLRAMASEGKITGQVIADALIGKLEEVRVVAGEMPATVADAFTRIGTNLTQLVGNFDTATGASAALAQSLIGVADWLGALAQTDFAAWAASAAGLVETLGQGVLILAATQIPALVTAILAVNVSAAIMNAQFIAGAIASRAITVAMGIQAAAARGLSTALAMVGGPIGLAVAGVAALGFAIYNTHAAYAEWAIATNNVATAQSNLNTALDNFSRDKSVSAVEAARKSAQDTVDAITAQIAAAENAKWFWESTDDIAAMKGELIGALAILEMTNTAYTDINAKTAEAKNGLIALNEEQQKSAATADEMVRTYRDRAALAAIEAQSGRDSAQYLQEQLNQERQITFAKINALDITNQQKAAARAAYDQMVITEAKTRGWNVELTGANTKLSSAYQALINIRDTQPGAGWLSAAISKAAGLAATLWDAVAANSALSATAIIGGSDERGSQRRIVHEATGFVRDNLLAVAAGGGGGGGGGGGSDRQSGIDSLVSELQTERETIDAWYAEKLAKVAEYTDLELAAIGGRNEAKIRLEAEYQDRLRGIMDSEKNYRLTETANMFDALSSVAAAGGKKALRAQAVLSAAATMIAAYEAAMKAAAEAKTIPGRIAAYAQFVGMGLKAAAAIRNAGGVGGGSGGSASTGGSAATAAAPAAPQNVIIDYSATADPAMRAMAAALLNPMIAQLQKASKTGINIVAVKS